MWNLAIRRRITFMMIFIGVIGFGIFSLTRLNPELLPDITMPIAGVITTYSGAGPEEVENLITKPIEEAVMTVKGVSEVVSIIEEGSSITIVRFSWGYDMDQAAFDIREKIDFIESYMPKDAQKPIVIKFDPTMIPILWINVSGDKPLYELRQIAEDDIKPQLERLEGVAMAEVFGGLEREIQINLGRNRMDAYGLTADDVIKAVAAQNITLPGGKILSGDKELTVRTMGEFTNVEEIENVIVTVKGNIPVYVRDIAEVLDTFEEKLTEVRIDGKPGLLLQIQKESGAVTVDVSKRVRKQLSNLTIPYDVNVDVMVDMAEFIQKAIGNLQSNILLGALLAIFILLLFMHNIRSTLIIAIAIPMSIIASFVAMDGFGISLNMMSMGGLALAVGMLVDNSIVVLENIFRHREEGLDKKKSSSIGTREVAVPVTASTITTLAIFLPVLFIPGMIGIMSRDLSLTVSISLAVSLVVSLTLIPLLTSMFLKIERTKLNPVSVFMKNLMKRLDSLYQNILNWCLDHRKIVILGTIGLFILSILIVFPFRLVGTEFMSGIDSGYVEFIVRLPEGSRLEETANMISRIADIGFDEIPEVESVVAMIGGGDIEMITGQSGRSNRGVVDFVLVDKSQRRRTQKDIEEFVRGRIKDLPGVEIVFTEEMSGAMMGFTGSAIELEIYGTSFDELDRIANEVESIVEGIPGTRDVEISREEKKPEIQLLINRKVAQSVGIPVFLIANAINDNVRGTVASIFREEGEEYKIRVRLREKDRETIDDILAIPLRTPFGSVVRLQELVDVNPAFGPRAIEHKGQQRIITVMSNVTGRDIGSVTRDIQREIKNIVLPKGYSINLGGQAEEQRKSFMWLAIAMIGAVFLVYMVMASLFESFIDPFTIMFTVPLAIIGVIWLMFLTNTTFSVMAFVGAIVLVGIVVNNGIVLIHYINLLRREQNVELREAIVLGGRRRLRPILMTALTTIFAMIPMAIGMGTASEMRTPMARAIVGGLTTSTFLTLVFLPVLYFVFETMIQRIKAKRGIRS